MYVLVSRQIEGTVECTLMLFDDIRIALFVVVIYMRGDLNLLGFSVYGDCEFVRIGTLSAVDVFFILDYGGNLLGLTEVQYIICVEYQYVTSNGGKQATDYEGKGHFWGAWFFLVF